jgi:hypothetical protein
MFAELFIGYLLDLFGRKYLSIWGFIVYGGFLITYPLATSIWKGYFIL